MPILFSRPYMLSESRPGLGHWWMPHSSVSLQQHSFVVKNSSIKINSPGMDSIPPLKWNWLPSDVCILLKFSEIFLKLEVSILNLDRCVYLSTTRLILKFQSIIIQFLWNNRTRLRVYVCELQNAQEERNAAWVFNQQWCKEAEWSTCKAVPSDFSAPWKLGGALFARPGGETVSFKVKMEDLKIGMLALLEKVTYLLQKMIQVRSLCKFFSQ